MVEIVGVHPLAEVWPIHPEDYTEVRDSIRSNGLRNPLVATPDGLLIDGRTRYRACQELGIDFQVVTYAGSDILEYIADCNGARRHMTNGARAMATALMLAQDGRRKDGRWNYGALTELSESGQSDFRKRVNEAGTVLDHAPDLADQVVSGDLALDAAYKQALDARDAERQQLEEAKRLEAEETEARIFIVDAAPDLAEQTGEGKPYQTYVEALAIWERRNREQAAELAREKARKEADEKVARDNKVQAANSIAQSLLVLSGAEYPEWRARNAADFPGVAVEVPPTARAMHEPDAIRRVAHFLTTYADELEAS